MTGAQFAQEVRRKTSTDSTTLPDAEIASIANVQKDKIANLIVDVVDEDYFQFSFVRHLKDSTGDVGERQFALPANMIQQLKAVYAKLGEPGDESWLKLDEIDTRTMDDPLVTEEHVISAMNDRGRNGFALIGDSLWVLSQHHLTDVTDGLQIEAMQFPMDIGTEELSGARSGVDLSVPPDKYNVALPRETHGVWALRVSIEFKESREKPIPLTASEQNVAVEERQMLANLSGRNLNRDIVANVPYNDGSQY
jgi:hypothetical protein